MGFGLPHIEGSHPFTREHLKLTFGGLPEDETTKLLTTNAARVYHFDLDALAPLAERICPTKAEVAAGIDYSQIPEEAKAAPA